MRKILLFGMMVIAGVCGAQTTQSLALASAHNLTLKDAMDLGREDTQKYYALKTKPLWGEMSNKMHAGLKDEAGFAAIAQKLTAQLGAEKEVLHEDVTLVPPDLLVYTRVAKFEKYPGTVVVTFAFGPSRSIEGFFVKPEPNPAPSDKLDYVDKTKLTWPLEGSWTVYQGGRTVGINYHAASPDQRFAYDLVRVVNGKLFDGKGDKDTDWYSFGKPVLATADGKVASAVDQYEDNVPNTPSDADPKQGNAIVIDHGDGEFSMYAHLKKGSLLVKAGDTVKAGQKIAEVGNSGNAPFSHLHYHLQTTPDWMNGLGLPTTFVNVKVDGKAVESAEPVRGEVVERRK